jgi:hypothetical protein
VSWYFGWPWGKFERPSHAPRFHAACLVAVLLASARLAIGRRLRATDDPYPARVPLEAVATIDRRQVSVALGADTLKSHRLEGRVRDKFTGRIPGGTR